MTVVPTGTKVLVRLMEEDNRSKGGILYPDSAKPKPQRGEVLGVGHDVGRDSSGKLKDAEEIRKGDIVAILRQATEPVPGEEGLVIVEERHILCKYI